MSRPYLPAGTYYVGDLCYVLDLNKDGDGYDWHAVLDGTHYLGTSPPETPKGYEAKWVSTGHFTIPHYDTGEPVRFFSSSTAYGDGSYTDGEGRSYAVDAGLIGCFPIEALPTPCGNVGPEEGGHIVTFAHAFRCRVVDEEGVIRISDIEIDTDPSPLGECVGCGASIDGWDATCGAYDCEEAAE